MTVHDHPDLEKCSGCKQERERELQQVRNALDEFAIAIGHIYGIFDEERIKNFDKAKERLNREKKSAVSVCLARVKAITTGSERG